MTEVALLHTSRLLLALPEPRDAPALRDYQQRNRHHFQPWEPRREAAFYTEDATRERIDAMVATMRAQTALHLLLRTRDSGAMVGECAFTNIVRGAFQACHLGFSVSAEFEGQGYVFEGLQCALEHVFGALALHRVMANVRPENLRSQRLLQRLGFEQEGRARAYLHIDGAWRDHILTSLINPQSR